MNRRQFLFNALTGLFVAATPKIFIDLGANLVKPEVLIPKEGEPYLTPEVNLLYKKIWEEELFKAAEKESYFSKFMGGEETALKAFQSIPKLEAVRIRLSL